jgi:lysozyme family protein
VIGVEGGFDADPRDRGNWTGGQIGVGRLNGSKFGISAAAYPTLAVADLTLDDAIGIYRMRYWVPAACDHLPDGLDLVVFDSAVNSGVAQSARWLQRSVGAQEDGLPDTATITAVQRAVQAQGLAAIAAAVAAERLLAMTEMPAWLTYRRGWARRVCALGWRAR